ncbi:MAG: response regulator transcription factor [Alphaproteobacteria bacterium]|nr:response regulator transcription factor [Alphaproteobacteria bacterium]
MDAVAGRLHCAPHIAAAMFSRLTVLLKETDPRRALPSLSARENEILALVDQGRSNKEIARQLAISAATVKNHLHNLMQKLQVTRRGEAAARLRAQHPAPGVLSKSRSDSPSGPALMRAPEDTIA